MTATWPVIVAGPVDAAVGCLLACSRDSSCGQRGVAR
jgi:hypothetical protein